MQVTPAISCNTMPAAYVEAMPHDPDELWTIEEIALFSKIKKKTLQNHYTGSNKPKDFPNPIILATGGKRWIKAEIKRYFSH